MGPHTLLVELYCRISLLLSLSKDKYIYLNISHHIILIKPNIYFKTNQILKWSKYYDGSSYHCVCGLFLLQRSQEDLQTLVDAHKCIASLCHSKTKALQYIAGEVASTDKTVSLVLLLNDLTFFYFSFKVNLVHGGNVLDSGDLEVVESVAKTFLCRLSPLWGSGAKILSNFISNPDQFGNQTTLNISCNKFFLFLHFWTIYITTTLKWSCISDSKLQTTNSEESKHYKHWGSFYLSILSLVCVSIMY